MENTSGSVGVWLGLCMRCMVTTSKLVSLVSGPVWGGIGKNTGQWLVGGAHHPSSVPSRWEGLPIALSEDEGSGVSVDSYES